MKRHLHLKYLLESVKSSDEIKRKNSCGSQSRYWWSGKTNSRTGM